MPHSKEIINPNSYAIGVITEYYSEFFDFVYRNRHEDKKDALERFKMALDILTDSFIDETTFKNQLSEFSRKQTKTLSIIERQRKEIETLKSNIK